MDTSQVRSESGRGAVTASIPVWTLEVTDNKQERNKRIDTFSSSSSFEIIY